MSMTERKSVGPGPLARKVAKLRAEAELSLYELEKRSGVNRAKLTRIEKGVIRYPTITTLNKLADGSRIDRVALHDVAASGHSGPLPSLKTYLKLKFSMSDEQIAYIERCVGKIEKESDSSSKAA